MPLTLPLSQLRLMCVLLRLLVFLAVLSVMPLFVPTLGLVIEWDGGFERTNPRER